MSFQLLSAARAGNLELIKSLVKKGVIVNLNSFNVKTALHWTAFFGHTETAKFLIENGAHINVRDQDGRTPLHSACLKGHVQMVELLITNEADFNATDNNGKTALYYSSCCSQIKRVKLPTENNLQINPDNSNKKSSDFKIKETLIRTTLLHNPKTKKPSYVQKNTELLFIWNTQLKKVNYFQRTPILGCKKLLRNNFTKISRAGNSTLCSLAYQAFQPR